MGIGLLLAASLAGGPSTRADREADREGRTFWALLESYPESGRTELRRFLLRDGPLATRIPLSSEVEGYCGNEISPVHSDTADIAALLAENKKCHVFPLENGSEGIAVTDSTLRFLVMENARRAQLNGTAVPGLYLMTGPRNASYHYDGKVYIGLALLERLTIADMRYVVRHEHAHGFSEGFMAAATDSMTSLAGQVTHAYYRRRYEQQADTLSLGDCDARAAQDAREGIGYHRSVLEDMATDDSIRALLRKGQPGMEDWASGSFLPRGFAEQLDAYVEAEFDGVMAEVWAKYPPVRQQDGTLVMTEAQQSLLRERLEPKLEAFVKDQVARGSATKAVLEIAAHWWSTHPLGGDRALTMRSAYERVCGPLPRANDLPLARTR